MSDANGRVDWFEFLAIPEERGLAISEIARQEDDVAFVKPKMADCPREEGMIHGREALAYVK